MRRFVLLSALLFGAWSVWELSAQRSAPPRSVVLPFGGAALAVGDLNGDRKPDILTGRLDAVMVYLGDGRGGFNRAKGAPFAAGSNPNDLVLQDFNEDGRLDVAVANHEASYVTVLMGDGSGGLAPPARIPTPSRPHPHGVAAEDFNGDGHPDLAVESWSENTVLVFQNNGKAVFAAEPKRLAVGRTPYQKLRAGDLNNDGKGDLVTTNAAGSSVSIVCSHRSGTLRPAAEIAIAPSPFAVAIGDVNGDRYVDLAVAHRWGSVDPKLDALTVLIGSGDCAFAPSPESPLKVGASPTDVAIGDVDGDGIGDIATANMGSHDVTLFLGGRSGLRVARGSPIAVGRGPLAIVLEDLNGDNKADVVTGNGGSQDVSVVISP
jgi:hypothetical protein